MIYPQTGMGSLEPLLNNLYRINPVLQIQDQIIGWWFDQGILTFVKMYYWPAFLAGSADTMADLFNPETYSICRY